MWRMRRWFYLKHNVLVVLSECISFCTLLDNFAEINSYTAAPCDALTVGVEYTLNYMQRQPFVGEVKVLEHVHDLLSRFNIIETPLALYCLTEQHIKLFGSVIKRRFLHLPSLLK